MAIPLKQRGPSPDQIEAARICALPITGEWTEEQFELFCSEEMLAEAYDAGLRFLPKQAAAIHAYREWPGDFFPIGVGKGKTGIFLTIANIAYRRGVKRSMLFVPPSVLDQLMRRDVQFWRRRIPFPIMRPWCLGGLGRAARAAMARSKRPGLYVMPYSLLSQPDAMDLIELISPTLVMCDEAHILQNARAARTKRLLHYLNQAEPQFIAASGTITHKTISDYHHLVTLALKERSPLPRSSSMAYFWSKVLRSDVNELPDAIDEKGSYNPAAHALNPIIKWARKNFPEQKFPEEIEAYRRAYKLRLMSVPGVVATSDTDIGVSLTIQNETPAGAPAARLTDLIKKVQDEYKTPNGDEIDHAIHTYKWVYELSAGLFNQLTWPDEERLKKLKRSKEDLEQAQDHHALAQIYHSKLRQFFKDSPPGLDTPRLVGLEMHKQHPRLPDELIEAYWMMKNADDGNLVVRDKRAVRVDPWKVEHAVAWALQREGGLLWIWNKALGDWLIEELRDVGLDPIYASAGMNEEICDPANANRIVVASIASHGIGKNLQHFQNQLFVQWPRDCRTAEQTIGRTHRTGQLAEELIVTTNRCTQFDHVNFAACLNDAVYVQQTTGMQQKVVYCNHDPLPMIFSPEFLREQGASPDMLNTEQRAMLKELFGATT